MGWLENLTSLLHIDVDLSSLKEVKLTNKIGLSLFKIDKSRNLTLNLGAKELDNPAIRKELARIIHDALNEEGQPIIEQNASRLIDDIASSNTYEGTVRYLTGKIPDEDITILRACTYIRTVHERGGPVDHLKMDIIERYGQRGANISNICSTGYFESYIIPMYQELEQRPNFKPATFTRYYNRIVSNVPFAIFVNRNQSAEEVKAQTIRKIEFNKKYGIKDLNIHAMGRENVHKVQSMLADPSVQVLFAAPPDIAIEGNIILVQLYY